MTNVAPRQLFHATYAPYLDAVLSGGLVPGASPANWPDSRPGHVYLASDPELARFIAETSDLAPNHCLVHVLEVEVDDALLARVEPDDTMPGASDVFQVRGSVPATLLGLHS